MIARILSGLIVVLLPLMSQAQSGQPAVQFSAEAVQNAPQAQPQVSRMYVGDGRVRTERTLNGEQAVEIIDMKRRTVVLILPQQGTYMMREEDAGTAKSASNSDTQNPDAGPCAGVPGAQCRKLGTETIDGRETDKWEMVVNYNGNGTKALYWIDQERGLPLKQFWPDGTVSELRLLGREQVGGRDTEKWQTTITQSDGRTSKSLQWFDPELQIAIREQLPGGFLRELRNIQVGPQPDQLFEIPKGLSRVEAPAPPGQQ